MKILFDSRSYAFFVKKNINTCILAGTAKIQKSRVRGMHFEGWGGFLWA